jgi:hypothetical protein
MKKGHYPILHNYFAAALADVDLLKPNEIVANFFVRKLNSNAANIYIAA